MAAATEPFPIESHWLASGSLGSDFGIDAEDPSVNFAGTIGYLWRGIFGGEFQANFSPDFQLDEALSPLLFGEEPTINSYMLNAIGAAPLMAGGQFQPYVSGGIGWVTLHADALPGDDFDQDDTQLGGNIGAGVMGFLGQLGVRADIRYFRVFEDEFFGVPEGAIQRAGHGMPHEFIDTRILSELAFWRGNVGVALRW